MQNSDLIKAISSGLVCEPLPDPKNVRSNLVPHAPKRSVPLNDPERKLAVRNALRYFPPKTHFELAPEFLEELELYGHIYMYRFMPECVYEDPTLMRAHPVTDYPAKDPQAAAIMLMICNNLDPRVAQFPHELVTYGGNGQVFSNWAQFLLVMWYLSIMTEGQTLVIYSGHPLGLFPSNKTAPRLVVTNGMMIPNYSTKDHYDKFFALGVTQYGQMTAGSYCYIGPQGIVHGTTLTILNAGRRYLGVCELGGRVLVTSGLGGMSGAQAKAAVIAGCVCVIAEISPEALKKRHAQGWLMEYTESLDECVTRIRQAKMQKKPLSLGYLGNVVDLWEKLAKVYKETGELLVDLGSDQTSCHNPFNGGYYPVDVTYEKAQTLLAQEPAVFKQLVQKSLLRQIEAIDVLAVGGLYFWDYGNAFLLECHRAGANVLKGPDSPETVFKYPSYVQDIIGDIFSLGFGPFRWVCASNLVEDLEMTDEIAAQTLKNIVGNVGRKSREQYEDNIKWIQEAQAHQLVVGSQARILYSDQEGRVALALAFNQAIKDGRLKGPVILSRDHHDVSGTDSPFRETSNIFDGSAFTADMAVQNCIGDSFRGASWVSLHNGGGVGWGDVINGGFGLVLDGTTEAGNRAKEMLNWDVSNGVSRRCWSGNPLAKEAIERAMELEPRLKVTLPNSVEDSLLD